jgi:hypothetical protein
MNNSRFPAATAAEIDRVHLLLFESLRGLEHALATESEVSPICVLNQLTATHGQITEHFQFEEQNGWMDEVRKQEPRLEHAIEGLREEHRELVQSLDTLIEELKAKEKLNEAGRHKIVRWIERVRAHESRENELLEDAFEEDLGAGD